MTTPAVSTATHSAHAVPGLTFDVARLAERRNTLGASEIPAVAGFNSKRTALDVYLEKRGIVAPFAGNEYTEWGLRLEDAIARKYAEVKGVELVTSETLVKDGWQSCTPDRLIVLGPNGADRNAITPAPVRGLEVKRFGEYRADDFGVPGTGEVPLDVTAQCLWSMQITGLMEWHLAVLIGQADFRIYHIDYDIEAAEALHDIGFAFWHNHVVAGIEPPLDGSKSAHRYLQQKYATHTAVLLEPTADILDAGRELALIKGEIKALELQRSALEHRIQSAIGDAAGIRNVATWKLDKTGRCSWKNVAEAFSAIDPVKYQQLVARHTSAPSRRFRLLVEED